MPVPTGPGGGLLTAAQLTSIQAFAATVLDKVCVIQRPSRVADALGGYTETDPVVATVYCSVTPPTGAFEVAMASRIVAISSYHVNLPIATDVRAQDQLLIEGSTLVVGTVYQPHSYGVFVQVFASRFQ